MKKIFSIALACIFSVSVSFASGAGDSCGDYSKNDVIALVASDSIAHSDNVAVIADNAYSPILVLAGNSSECSVDIEFAVKEAHVGSTIEAFAPTEPVLAFNNGNDPDDFKSYFDEGLYNYRSSDAELSADDDKPDPAFNKVTYESGWNQTYFIIPKPIQLE